MASGVKELITTVNHSSSHIQKVERIFNDLRFRGRTNKMKRTTYLFSLEKFHV